MPSYPLGTGLKAVPTVIHPIEHELIERWKDIEARNRDVLNIWQGSDYRLCIAGIDITEAEIAAAQARIAQLDVMIAALEKAQGAISADA